MSPAKLSQHFLKDTKVIERILAQIPPQTPAVLEIGSGGGALTRHLRTRCSGPLIVVELDRKLMAALRRELPEGIEWIAADIRSVELEAFGASSPFTIVGNIPYAISRDIVDWIFRERERIAGGVLMVQREFFQKLSPAPTRSKKSARGMLFNHLFKVEPLFTVPPGCFSPPPRVDSTVFSFTRAPRAGQPATVETLKELLDLGFSNRRKTLRNNLAVRFGRNLVEQAVQDLGLPPGVRADQLELADFVSLTRILATSRTDTPQPSGSTKR